jgi:hypothetical protein
VRVTFDPAAAGIDQATFDSVATPNLASFTWQIPSRTNNDIGAIDFDPASDAIETVRLSGIIGHLHPRGHTTQLNELKK